MANLFNELSEKIGETVDAFTSTENDELEEDDEEEDEGINPYLVLGIGAAVAGGGYLAWRHFHPKKEGEPSWLEKRKAEALEKLKGELKKDNMEVVGSKEFEEFKKWKESQKTEENNG